jgi:hypothetical protein
LVTRRAGTGYPAGVHRLLVAIVILAGCSKKAAPPPERTWLALTPMPLELQAPANATVAQTQESTDRTAPPGMIVSARECILVVTPGSRGDVVAQEQAIAAQHPGVTVTRREPPAANGTGLYLGYEYAGTGGAKLRSFRSEWTIGETTYRCEPFTGRADVACEDAACRSLRALP